MDDFERSEASELFRGDASERHDFPGYLVERYRAWRARLGPSEMAWAAQLASEGQHPRAMAIACCDSRVDVNAMFGAQPGELFVVRNVANLVPPFAPDHLHHSTSAAIEYAVTALHVSHIIVIGHAGCGGVAAAHDFCDGKASPALLQSSFLRRWTDILSPAYERVKSADAHAEPGCGCGDRDATLRAMELEGVRTSIGNLMTFPFVREAVDAGRLTLHGAWVDISAARLMAVSSAGDGRFMPV